MTEQRCAECDCERGGDDCNWIIPANKRRTDTPKHRHKAPEGECKTCDKEREAGNRFHPPHEASPNCKSGKRNHCSCDTCF